MYSVRSCRMNKYSDISELSGNSEHRKFRIGEFHAAQIYPTIFTYNTIYLNRNTPVYSHFAAIGRGWNVSRAFRA